VTDDQGKKDIILNNLEVGTLAKPKMYNSLLKKINKDEILSKKELETFNELDKELRDTYTPGKESSPEQKVSQTKEVPEPLKNLHAVVKYLEEKGYKIKKSSVYNHQAAGKIRPNKAGEYPVAAVDKYAAVHLKLADGTPSGGKALDKAQKEKADAETREKLARARHWELRTGALEGKLVPRELFENELAGRAAIFRADGENFFRSQVSAIVNIVSGDPAKIPELMSYCLDAHEQWLARYLQKEEFKVDTSTYEKIFEQADKDDLDNNSGDDDTDA
jgi:hypothetical protein